MDGKTIFEIHGNGQMDTKVQFEIEFSYLDHYNLNDEYLSFKINGKHFSFIVKCKENILLQIKRKRKKTEKAFFR